MPSRKIRRRIVISVATVYPNTPAEAGGIREGDLHRRRSTRCRRRAGRSIKSPTRSPARPAPRSTSTFARPGVAAPINANVHARRDSHSGGAVHARRSATRSATSRSSSSTRTRPRTSRAAVKQFQAQGARGIIIDLRGDPGGILDQSLEIANMFLPAGPADRRGEGTRRSDRESTPRRQRRSRRPFRSSFSPTNARLPRPRSSTGALQDHDRALVVGQTSFGKGLVQGVYNLDGGYALKLTTGKWFTPSGRSIQRPRKFVNGQFVEETAGHERDERDARRTRPAYKSDAGRVVYGGGGITPDVIVQDDTLTTAEQQFTKAVAPKGQDFFTALNDYSRGAREDGQRRRSPCSRRGSTSSTTVCRPRA